ncbi:MAG: glycosyltransferase family 4 protein [Burkholderiales bacterium]|nr:glycosyltransferase family 4 protein [Phycisphaerae bacterium]
MIETKPRTTVFKQIALVTGAMEMGGIQTLIVRIARNLVSKGERVNLLCSGGLLIKDLPTSVRVLTYSSWQDAQSKFAALNGEAGRDGSMLIVSFDPTSASLASWLMGRSPRGIGDRHITGVFHPRAYFLDGEDRLRFAINRMILSNFCDDQIFFMNNECRVTHAKWSWRNFSRSPVLPLGIEIADSRYRTGDENSFIVVSVGRLVAFKDFNLSIPQIVHDLRKKGLPIEWKIFGAGELKGEIIRRINYFDVDSFVDVQPELPYANFAEKVANHDVFVGMGTAALESAMVGVPTLLAVDRQGELSYGFLQDLPFGNVGEQQDKSPTLRISDLLFDLYSKSAQQRYAIGQQSRKAALAYSADDYTKGLLLIGATSSASKLLRSWIYGMLYHEATDGLSRGFVNRAVRAYRRLALAIPRTGQH